MHAITEYMYVLPVQSATCARLARPVSGAGQVRLLACRVSPHPLPVCSRVYAHVGRMLLPLPKQALKSLRVMDGAPSCML